MFRDDGDLLDLHAVSFCQAWPTAVQACWGLLHCGQATPAYGSSPRVPPGRTSC